jgi:hypothetical protein
MRRGKSRNVPERCLRLVPNGSGYKSEVWVDDGGSRVAVLLLNARHYDTAQPAADQSAHDTLARLYCHE